MKKILPVIFLMVTTALSAQYSSNKQTIESTGRVETTSVVDITFTNKFIFYETETSSVIEKVIEIKVLYKDDYTEVLNYVVEDGHYMVTRKNHKITVVKWLAKTGLVITYIKNKA